MTDSEISRSKELESQIDDILERIHTCIASNQKEKTDILWEKLKELEKEKSELDYKELCEKDSFSPIEMKKQLEGLRKLAKSLKE